jgi:hypothetical protein
VLTVVTNVEDAPAGPARGASLIDEIVREGARRMLAAALEAEVAAYIAAHAGELDERGHRLVVRNGHAVPRQVLTSAGAVAVRAPRVNDKRVDENSGERRQFSSAILPACCRKSPKINEVLPLLYLHGLSSKDFTPALEGFLGTDAGLSAATITRLTTQAGRRSPLRRPGSVQCGLRLPVGRRSPPQRPPGRGEAVPARHDRGTGRRYEGAHRPGRWLPRVDRLMGRPAA